ncbi:F0F1 ATP synthase subunit delta [Blochmannia endosymbiont of Colobopsis nipponica]|uniref:F0F1 ATP synthase subunit delta n=1 Tax=Blochmannia endosymbiont of Colobopsis nipponica TaxID=2681987 RepID=UPI00177DB1E4|nr:F0F1 ATP synthase subunit delta [Blochmannia endosymbiont of Colobopsis nipponica]QOI10840.1 F0F1 ATP synthase subunit delta [Blochmannia endosymbiont of Colobopsis nipponica]
MRDNIIVNSSTIARPYAVAAFNFAVEQQKVPDWQSMLLIASNISKNEKMLKIFSSNRFTSTQLLNIFIDVCGKSLDHFVRNFIRIMAKNSRLLVLPEVVKQFINLRTVQENFMDVEVISPYLLTDLQLSKITEIIEKKVSKKIKLICKVEPLIVAGLIIRMNNTVLDSSLQRRLEHLKNILQF